MIPQRTIRLNNIRNLELDQLAVRALYDPARRQALLDRISPLDRPVAEIMDSIDTYMGPNGCESHYTYIPEGIMIRRLWGGLRNILQSGMLEYDKVHRDRRGHFFDLDLGYSLPKDDDDAILCVSHYTANRWAAEKRLKIVEDVEAVDMIHTDPSMRVYSSNFTDGNTVPDIPITDIDLIAVSARPQEQVEELVDMASPGLRYAVRRMLFPAEYDPSDKAGSLLPSAGAALSGMGCRPVQHGNILKDRSAVLFWEIQKFCVFQNIDDGYYMKDVLDSMEAIRHIIRAEPELWGKTGEGYFDPLGIINYMIRSGKLSVSE